MGINILDKSVFNRISAGEVVERPFSVVKELVENAIDAKATEIRINVDDGGISCIEVADNGCGIEYDDIAKAFLPHATSKISTAKEKIQSLEEFEYVIGKIEFKGIGTIETEIVEPGDVIYGEGSLFMCLSKVSTNAIWRTRRLGDVFAKLGSGSKKLNDYFTDKKVDVDVRDMIPLLVVQNQVLVVAGLDVSENVKIDGNTDQIVKITFHSK